MASAVGYFKASNTAAGDFFAHTIAMSDDGGTLAVTALFEDSAATGINGDQGDNLFEDAGAVYVFTRSNGVWSQQAYLKASNTGADDRFGNSVALSADGNTLAVGAWLEDSANVQNPSDNAATNAGAACVFVRDGDVWNQQAYLKDAAPDPEDQFGYAVALSANGDTLAVSAWNAGSVGRVRTFVRAAGVWSGQASLSAPIPDNGDSFGFSLALADDGVTLAVGAWQEDSMISGVQGNASADNSVTDAGAAYVFELNQGVWTLQAFVKADNPGMNDKFGYRVALSGDGDMLAVSAALEDSDASGIFPAAAGVDSAPNAGAVYIYERDGNTWMQTAYVKAPNTNAGDQFGESVALSADGQIMAIGAPNEDSAAAGVDGPLTDNFAIDAGAVYVYVREADGWPYRSYIKAPNAGAGDYLGLNAALSADGGTLAIGVSHEDSAAIDINGNQANNTSVEAGAAYLF